MAAHLPNPTRDRILELERTVETLATRVKYLERRATPSRLVLPRPRFWHVWLWNGTPWDGAGKTERVGVRENRRIDGHVVGSKY